MKKTYQKIVVIVSGLAMLTTMTVAGFSFRPSSNSPSSTSENIPSPDERLQSIIEGYEAVLEREPDNPTAQQGLEEALKTLVATQIQAQNLTEAIPPMEKLAALVPDNEQYQEVLKQMKEAQKTATTTPPTTPPNPTDPNADEPLPLIIPEAEPESNPLLAPENEPNSNPF